MKCLGRTKKFKKCQRDKFPFCHQHRFQIILWIVSIGTGLIWITDLSESLGLKRPYEYINYTENKIKGKKEKLHENGRLKIIVVPFYTIETNQKCSEAKIIKQRLDYINEQQEMDFDIEYIDTSIDASTLSISQKNELLISNNASVLIFGSCSKSKTNLMAINYYSKGLILSNNFNPNLAPFDATSLSQGKIQGELESSILMLSLKLRIIQLGAFEEFATYSTNGLVNEFKRSSFQKSKNLILEIRKNYHSNINSELFFSESIVYLLQDSLNKSIEAMKNAIKIESDNDNSSIYYNLGYVYILKESYDLAIKEFDKVRITSKQYLPTLLNKGFCFSRLEKYNIAIGIYNQILKIDSLNEMAFINLSASYGYLNQFSKSKEYAFKAIKVNRNNCLAYKNLGYAEMSTSNYQNSLQYLRKAIALGYREKDIFNDLGVCFMSMERFDEAIIEIDKAISIDQNYIEAMINKAYCLLSLERYNESLQIYNKILALKQIPEIFANRALVYFQLGNNKEALKDYDSALKYIISPDLKCQIILNKAIILHSDKFYKLVVGMITEFKKNCSLNEVAYYYLIDSLIEMKQTDKAKIFLDTMKLQYWNSEKIKELEIKMRKIVL